MTAPITLSPLDTTTVAELRHQYEETTKVQNRTRYQMILLALRGLRCLRLPALC